MARPITVELPKRDARIELQSRLAEAPAEHAEAILAAYEVLQGLHDRGVLEILRGALGSSEKVLEIAVAAARSPESVRGIRNLLVLVNMFGAIDPEAMKTFAGTLPAALEAMNRESRPMGFWKLIWNFLWNEDFRRGMGKINLGVEAIGGGRGEIRRALR